MKRKFASFALLAALVVAVGQACGGGGGDGNGPGDGGPDGSRGGFDGSLFNDAPFGDGQQGGLVLTPCGTSTLKVVAGQMTPTQPFTATSGGAKVSAAWTVDRGDIGVVTPTTGSSVAFVPSGAVGGLVTVTAAANGQSTTCKVMVQLTAQQNGANPGNPGEGGQIAGSPGSLGAGGGVGGVGGEGLGGPVTDPNTIGALGNPMNDGGAQSLAFLYPYDKTVWPRGMLAPLLMWSWATNDADAIEIKLSTSSGSFSYTGVFGRPAVLGSTGGPFIRHPIPQDFWDMATNSAGGKDTLTLELTIAKGGQGYGPISQTWTVAQGRLTGTVYYNSYGTQLVKNWTALDGANHSVGAAILGVRSGDLGPKLVVGVNSPTNAAGNPADDSGCRVCHVVSSRGRWLLTQSEQGTPGDGLSFLYDLTSINVQGSAATLPQQGVFGWAAMTSDGTFALSNSIDPSSSNPAITNSKAGNATSSFWQFGANPAAATATGLAAGLAAGYPQYAPDDKMIAYVDVTGQTANVQGSIMAATYAAVTHAFGTPQKIVSPAAGQRVGYPVFLPDDSGLLFETEVRASQSDSVMVTRNGARSELWWTTLGATPSAARLDALNGKSGGKTYLPILPNNHGIAGATDPQSSYDETGQDDTTLDYEPTVLPIVSGGYAWVVFTSRRAYGNQLGDVPWKSWPPDYDTTNLAVATVKKLWVAAIDLNAPPGTDPSHPAFYLPAQEILAGNSRGFWVLDPCKTDGSSCQSGDQCCNGYCEPNGDAGALVCSNAPPTNNCSMPQEKCTTAANCCDATNVCINGFCAENVR